MTREQKRARRAVKQAGAAQRASALRDMQVLRERNAKLVAENTALRAACASASICLCEADVEEPGEHLETCPWNDPDYEGGVS